LTPADAVGLAFRIARLDWRDLIRIFWICACFYNFSYSLAAWIPAGCPTALANVVLAISVGMVLFSRFEMRTLQLAIMLLLDEGAPDIRTAIKSARKQPWQVCKSSWPIFMADVAFIVGSLFLTDMLRDRSSNVVAIIQHLELLVGFVALGIPYSCIDQLSLVYLCVLSSEKATLWMATKRMYFLVSHNIGYAFSSILLFVFVNQILEYTSMLVIFDVYATNFVPYFLKVPVGVCVKILEVLIASGPLYSFLAAASAIVASIFLKQMAMRAEGTDLIDQLMKVGSEK
jgi:hypothetical protein